MKNENNKVVLRWMFFIPLSIVIFFFSMFCINLTFFFIDKSFVEAINLFKGFGGYLILGPIYVLFRDSIVTGLAIYSGVYLAPKNKKTVFFFFLLFYVLILLIISFSLGASISLNLFTFEDYFRIFITIIAHVIGFLFAGIRIWKEESAKNLIELN